MPENKIVLLGVLGAGAYLAYEYMQYSTEINTVSGGIAANKAQLEGTLPFLTYVGMKWGIGTVAAGTPQSQQQQLFNAMTGAPPGVVAQAPGTTSSGQPTSVSTAPTSTTTTTVTTTPTPSSMQTLASNMEQTINMTSASADQWNWAFSHIIGQNIDAKYGFQFDAAYGPITGPANARVRNNGATMSALMFLQLAAGQVKGGLPGLTGFGTIARFPGPTLNTIGNLIYRAHHQLPYAPSYTLRGLGAVVQATGFEKILFANQPLRSNRVR